MTKPQGRLDRICRKLGVQIIPCKQQRTKAKQTHARRTLAKILSKHGEGHLTVTMRCIVEGENNKNQLFSETIGAVSDVLLFNPELEEMGFEILDLFAQVSLEHIRNRVKQMGFPDGSRRQHMRALLACELQEMLEVGE